MFTRTTTGCSGFSSLGNPPLNFTTNQNTTIMEMSQYEISDALECVEGYYLPRPNESREAAFTRAQEEAVKHLQRRADNARAVTFERFSVWNA